MLDYRNKSHDLTVENYYSFAASWFLWSIFFIPLGIHFALATQLDIHCGIEALNTLCSKCSTLIYSASTTTLTSCSLWCIILSLYILSFDHFYKVIASSIINLEYLLYASVLKTKFTLCPDFALALMCYIPISLAYLSASSSSTVLYTISHLFPAIIIGASFWIYFLSSKYQVFTFSNESRSVTSYTSNAPMHIWISNLFAYLPDAPW